MNKLIKKNQDNISIGITIATIICLSIYLLLQVNSHSVNLVFSDQIDIIFSFFEEKNLLELFMQQHGPHRQGVGALIMYPVLYLGSWNIELLSYLTVIILIVSTIIFTISMRNMRVSPLTIIVVIILLLSYASVELITITPNISHTVLPILFLSLITLLLSKNYVSIVKTEIFIFLLVFLSLFTGFGIFTFLAYIVVVVIRGLGNKFNLHNKHSNYFKIGIYILIGLTVISFLFMYQYNFSQAEGCARNAFINLLGVIKYAGAITSLVVGGQDILGEYSIQVGVVILLVQLIMSILITMKLYTKESRELYIIMLLLLISIGFVLNAAIGRHCLGISSAYASRYYLLVIPGIVGMLLTLDLVYKNIFIKFTFLFFIAVSQLFFAQSQYISLGRAFFNHKNNFIICISNGKSVDVCNKKFSIYPPSSSRLNELLILTEVNK